MPREIKNASPDDSHIPDIPKELLDRFVTGPMTAGDVEAVMHKLKKAVIERVLGAEMSYHLGYSVGETKPEGAGNHRNGNSGKTVLTDDGPLRIDILHSVRPQWCIRAKADRQARAALHWF